MSPKFMLLLMWVFYIAVRRTGDDLWLFCMIASGVLTVCTFFYKLENKSK